MVNHEMRIWLNSCENSHVGHAQNKKRVRQDVPMELWKLLYEEAKR